MCIHNNIFALHVNKVRLNKLDVHQVQKSTSVTENDKN